MLFPVGIPSTRKSHLRTVRRRSPPPTTVRSHNGKFTSLPHSCPYRTPTASPNMTSGLTHSRDQLSKASNQPKAQLQTPPAFAFLATLSTTLLLSAQSM